MSGMRRTFRGALEHGVAVALGLSGVFLALLLVATPVVATLVAVPASIAVGVARARRVPLATPHSLTTPTFGDRAVMNAPTALSLVSSKESASSAA